jgi:hypothetical protein
VLLVCVESTSMNKATQVAQSARMRQGFPTTPQQQCDPPCAHGDATAATDLSISPAPAFAHVELSFKADNAFRARPAISKLTLAARSLVLRARTNPTIQQLSIAWGGRHPRTVRGLASWASRRARTQTRVLAWLAQPDPPVGWGVSAPLDSLWTARTDSAPLVLWAPTRPLQDPGPVPSAPIQSLFSPSTSTWEPLQRNARGHATMEQCARARTVCATRADSTSRGSVCLAQQEPTRLLQGIQAVRTVRRISRQDRHTPKRAR